MIFYFYLMGKSSEIQFEDSETTIEKLKNNIKTFIANQKDNTTKIFEDESYEKQNIEYSINDNGFQKEEDNVKNLEDYAIQWSIQGKNKLNTTNCHLSLFNIGGF